MSLLVNCDSVIYDYSGHNYNKWAEVFWDVGFGFIFLCALYSSVWLIQIVLLAHKFCCLGINTEKKKILIHQDLKSYFDKMSETKITFIYSSFSLYLDKIWI